MKRSLRILLPLLVLGLLLFAIRSVANYSHRPTEKELHERIKSGGSCVAILDAVLRQPESYSTRMLLMCSMVALKEQRIEDCGFLFFAAQMRKNFDLVCFKPKGKGGDSPGVEFAALSHSFGQTINPTISANPAAYAKVAERIKAWQPSSRDGYDPGYEYTERMTETAALEATKSARENFVKSLIDASTLLNDPEYFAAFKIVQNYYLTPPDKRPAKEIKDQAVDEIVRIEKEKGIQSRSEFLLDQMKREGERAKP